MVGVAALLILFIIYLYGAILYESPLPIMWFLLMLAVAHVFSVVLKRRKGSEAHKRLSWWRAYKDILLLVLFVYPLISIPKYIGGTPLNNLIAGYITVITLFAVLGILMKACGLDKREYTSGILQDKTFMLKILLVAFVSLAITTIMIITFIKTGFI